MCTDNINFTCNSIEFNHVIHGGPYLKKLRQNLIIHQLSVKPLAEHLDLFEVILTKGKHVDTIFARIDQVIEHHVEFIKSIRFQPAKEYAFLDTDQPRLLARPGDFIPDLVFGNIVDNPDQNIHV